MIYEVTFVPVTRLRLMQASRILGRSPPANWRRQWCAATFPTRRRSTVSSHRRTASASSCARCSESTTPERE